MWPYTAVCTVLKKESLKRSCFTEKVCVSSLSSVVNISSESSLLYLTMRHAATLVHSAAVRSSGCEKGWQGLNDRRISALTGMFSADTGVKRPRKPSASPIAFRFITPLPSFMMHLQSLTLKHPNFLGEAG